MLTDTKIRSLKPREKSYKVSDRDGLYVVVFSSGTKSFRYDYRVNGRRETLTLGKYGQFGLTLAEAREELSLAKKMVANGISPAMEKQRRKRRLKDELRFGEFAELYVNSLKVADSTRALKQAVFEREIAPTFSKHLMTEISSGDIRFHCEAICDRGAPSTAIFVLDFFFAVYKFAISKGCTFSNPAESIVNSSIATFKPRTRSLTPREIYLFFNELNQSQRYFSLKKGVLFILYTLVRKSEFVFAKWEEFDLVRNVWTIPADRMKARRQHNVYLSKQVVELLTGFKIYCENSEFVIPSRNSRFKPVALSSLNRVVSETIVNMKQKGIEIDHFTIHDLRRTASTLLNEAGFNSDWIEKALAHEQQGVRAVYNKAEYSEQRKDMMQKWADLVDCWIRGENL